MKKDVIAWVGLVLSILGLVFTGGIFYNRVTVLENQVATMQKQSGRDHYQMQQDVEIIRKAVGTIRDQLILKGGVNPQALAQPMMTQPEPPPPPPPGWQPEGELRMPPLKINTERVP
jgi:hypothetical protein